MPRYGFNCIECGDCFELDLSVDDRDSPTLISCEGCGGIIKRMLGNQGGFRLLGGGWESDNYTGKNDLLGSHPEFISTYGKHNEKGGGS